jgi:hypothetical protein
MFEKNKDSSFLKIECFEHVNFAINGKCSKKNNDNSNYYVSLMIFQTYKYVVLRSVHSLEWLL